MLRPATWVVVSEVTCVVVSALRMLVFRPFRCAVVRAPISVEVPGFVARLTVTCSRSTVRAPIWLGGFDLATALRDFNPPGAKPGSPGAQVKCSVGPDGGLVGCVVELTSPDGRDYDAAAVALMSKLRMTLWSAEAGPVSGGVVHINVKRSDGE